MSRIVTTVENPSYISVDWHEHPVSLVSATEYVEENRVMFFAHCKECGTNKMMAEEVETFRATFG